MRLLKAGACLIQGLLKTGWTVFCVVMALTPVNNFSHAWA